MRARSRALQTFLIQLACGCGGYLPTDRAVAGGAPLDSPRFTGVPQAPTIPGGLDNSDQIATAAFVQDAIRCNIRALLFTQPFVFTFNGRKGEIVLNRRDIICA